MTPHHNCCAGCGVRDHALGGRTKTGDFMLALPIEGEKGRTSWPRLGSSAWCGTADGEVDRLTIVRISLTRVVGQDRTEWLCQHCLSIHQAQQGLFADLFSSASVSLFP